MLRRFLAFFGFTLQILGEKLKHFLQQKRQFAEYISRYLNTTNTSQPLDLLLKWHFPFIGQYQELKSCFKEFGVSSLQSQDPDMFVRVAERKPDGGVVLRGCKAHQSLGCEKVQRRSDDTFGCAFS